MCIRDRATVRTFFSAKAALLLPSPTGALVCASGDFDVDEKDLAAAEWVWTHGRAAGATTDTLASSRALFVPLAGSHGRVGVLALIPSDTARLIDPDERQVCLLYTSDAADERSSVD